MEVNVGNEESKYGFSFEEVLPVVEEVANLPMITVRGLMCVAPITENPETNRPLFHKMGELLVDIRSKNRDNVKADFLSMGMSKDYQVAIEEGATQVRVGTELFGPREYKGV